MNTELKNELKNELRTEISNMKSFVTTELEKAKDELRKEFDGKLKQGCLTESEIRKIKWGAIDTQARSRRNNLLLFGKKEEKDEY